MAREAHADDLYWQHRSSSVIWLIVVLALAVSAVVNRGGGVESAILMWASVCAAALVVLIRLSTLRRAVKFCDDRIGVRSTPFSKVRWFCRGVVRVERDGGSVAVVDSTTGEALVHVSGQVAKRPS